MFFLQKWFRIKPVTRAKVFENNLRTKIWKLVRTRILIFQLHPQSHPFLQIHKLSALPTPTRTMVWVRVRCVDPKPPSGVWVRPCFLSASKFSRGQKLLKKQTDESRLETTYHTPQLNSVRSEHTKHHNVFFSRGKISSDSSIEYSNFMLELWRMTANIFLFLSADKVYAV